MQGSSSKRRAHAHMQAAIHAYTHVYTFACICGGASAAPENSRHLNCRMATSTAAKRHLLVSPFSRAAPCPPATACNSLQQPATVCNSLASPLSTPKGHGSSRVMQGLSRAQGFWGALLATHRESLPSSCAGFAIACGSLKRGEAGICMRVQRVLNAFEYGGAVAARQLPATLWGHPFKVPCMGSLFACMRMETVAWPACLPACLHACMLHAECMATGGQ
eukprot:349849-Chlamydomonas_euryale.AAC.4